MALRKPSTPFDPLSEPQVRLRERLRRHIDMLASTIGERHIWRPPALAQARDYIRDELVLMGYDVQAQEYRVTGQAVSNLIAELKGGARADEILVIGAHYDSVTGCPAANDNASGVAATLEMARALRELQPARTIRFVAFVNEEPPFFHTEQMGSLVYARACRADNDNIVGMLSLETIGCYSDQKGSQRYPIPVQLIYPTVGNFIAFVSDRSSRKFLKRLVLAFRSHSRFPLEHAALPAAIPGIGWSDQWSFWQCGYPAAMITDTAPYRYAHYHLASDTPEKLHYDHMTRVVWGLTAAVRTLSD